jgi:hypothetical protein
MSSMTSASNRVGIFCIFLLTLIWQNVARYLKYTYIVRKYKMYLYSLWNRTENLIRCSFFFLQLMTMKREKQYRINTLSNLNFLLLGVLKEVRMFTIKRSKFMYLVILDHIVGLGKNNSCSFGYDLWATRKQPLENSEQVWRSKF